MTHTWTVSAMYGWHFCSVCGVVRNDKNALNPCKGPVSVKPRGEP